MIEMEEGLLTLDDCLRTFTQKERLEGENSWYCNKCKDFKEATKQMEIYKSNKILVLAFKRFSRVRKVRTMVKFPVEALNMGPYLLCKTTPIQPTRTSSPSSTTSTASSTITAA